MTDSPLLEAEDLTITYRTKSGELTAVSDVSFTIEEGEYFGLVGESGCGKSTTAKSILGGLDSNGEISSGKIRYRGEEIQDLTETELREEIRWKEISWIPQGSMNSLDPLQRVSEQAIEIGQAHTDLSEEEILDKFREMFDIVGLQESRISDYPHQFSGGMQQRTLIALALFLEPSILIADEPTTALDVIMQDQIFKYLDMIREETETSMLLITHDISLVFESCDRMGIMHAGQLAESGSVTEVYDSPRHPYAFMLQEAFPDVRYFDQELEVIDGTPPQYLEGIDECTFASRCPFAVPECRDGVPPIAEVSRSDDHRVGCIRSDEAYELYQAERGDEPDAGPETEHAGGS